MNWSYKKRLKLESMLILVSHPLMCMDSSPTSGLTVNLQHQLLSCHTIILNPFKNNFNSSKVNLSENDLQINLHKNIPTISKSSSQLVVSWKYLYFNNLVIGTIYVILI